MSTARRIGLALVAGLLVMSAGLVAAPGAGATVHSIKFNVANGAIGIGGVEVPFPARSSYSGTWNDATGAVSGTLRVPVQQVMAQGIPVNVTITQLGASRGTLDRRTGAARIPVSIKAELDALGLLPDGCAVTPIQLVLRTGGDGAPLNLNTGRMKVAASGFNVPASSNCGPLGATLDEALGLPTDDTSALLTLQQVAKPPSAPRHPEAGSRNHAARASWSPPANSGGALVTLYQAVAVPGGRSCTSTGLACVISGLTNGTRYQVKVRARNFDGWGPFSDLSRGVRPG